MMSRTITTTNSGWRSSLLLLMAASALAVSGCTKIDMPSTITENKIQLETENYSQSYKVATLGAVEFDEIADHYSRYGDSQAEVIVAYDPYSKKNTAMKATDQLHRIMSELSKRQVINIKGSILAVDYSGDESEMIVGYESVTAHAPDECGLVPGFDTIRAETDFDYKLGCSTQTMVARQVARPADLAGDERVTPGGDGRRASGVVEAYRAGEVPAIAGAASTN